MVVLCLLDSLRVPHCAYCADPHPQDLLVGALAATFFWLHLFMRDISYQTWIARGLARAFLTDWQQTGGTSQAALQARASAALGESPAWLKLLASCLSQLPRVVWVQQDTSALAERILNSESFADAFADGACPRIRRLFLPPPAMRPRPLGLDICALPDITNIKDLADCLALPIDRLCWLAQELPRQTEHYRYRIQAKRSGGSRLIEIPKSDLKHVQRAVYERFLVHVPVHEAAHGFVRQRSVLSHATQHIDQAVVIRFDLQDFFPSIRAARIRALWQTLGYPEAVARCLTALCTHRTAEMVVARLQDDGGLTWLGAKRLRSAHLPQGAPTSPALANLCAFALDLRLEGLAWVFGANYSRYADDLVFSGPESLRAQFQALAAWVSAVAEGEGFVLNSNKTRCLPAHLQQRVTGLVVNARLNTPRRDFDRLKACLHHCVRFGPQSQNNQGLTDYRGHLLGQIGWVGQANAARAKKLMQLFAQIDWSGHSFLRNLSRNP